MLTNLNEQYCFNQKSYILMLCQLKYINTLILNELYKRNYVNYYLKDDSVVSN